MRLGLLAGLLSARRRTGVGQGQTYVAEWLPFDPLTPRAAAKQDRQALMCYYISFPPGGREDLGAVNAIDVDTRWTNGVANDTKLLWYRNNTPGNTIGGGVYVWCAGFVRDRPAAQYQRAVRTEPKTTSQYMTKTPGGTTYAYSRDWRVLDRRDEILDMVRAGIMVVQIDMIGLPSTDGEWNPSKGSTEQNAPGETTWTGMTLRVRQAVETYEAVQMVRDLGYPVTISPYFDGVTTGTRTYTADSTRPGQFMADWLNVMDARFPGIHTERKVRGSGSKGILTSVYAPEKAPSYKSTGGFDLWASVRDLCDRAPAFLFVYQDPWIKLQGIYDALTTMVGRWGERNPVTTARENTDNRQLGDKLASDFPGNEYAAVVTCADVRPDQLKYDESRGPEQLTEAWATARGAGVVSGVLVESRHRAAELVHMPTWSDFREGAQWMPTVNHGWVFLDLSQYEMQRWQTGIEPEIVRPTAYMLRRTQRVDVVTVGTTRVHLRHALPSLADFPTVNSSSNPTTPVRRVNQGYIDLSTDKHYRWTGTAYEELPAKFPNDYLPYSQGGVQRPQRDYCGLLNPSTPSSDEVFFVLFMPAGTTYTATTTVCGTTTTRTVQPGVTRFSLPITGDGTTSIVVKNAGGTEVARIDPGAIPAVSSTLIRQDLNYHAAGSRDALARPLPPV